MLPIYARWPWSQPCSILILGGHVGEVRESLEPLYGFYGERLGCTKFGIACCFSHGVNNEIAGKWGDDALVSRREHSGILWFENAAKTLEYLFKDAQEAAEAWCKRGPPCCCTEVTISIDCSPDMEDLLAGKPVRGKRINPTTFQRELCRLGEHDGGQFQNRFSCTE
jgi:hypothetical protein